MALMESAAGLYEVNVDEERDGRFVNLFEVSISQGVTFPM